MPFEKQNNTQYVDGKMASPCPPGGAFEVLWDARHGMSQPQLEAYLHSGKVERLIVVQESDRQFWLAIRLVQDSHLWHLVTRRAQDMPRMFARMDVLMARLERVGPLKKPFWVVPLHARMTRRQLLRL